MSVVLVDDHEIVRRGIKMVIESSGDLEVVGEASTVAEGMAVVEKLRPDVALLDLRLPDGSGLELCERLRHSVPETACLMLTSFSDDDAMTEAALAGAVGYLLKQVRGSDIVDAVRSSAAGTSTMAAHLPDEPSPRERGDALVASLSPQERRILDRLARGASNREIADEMGLAEKTVKNYVSTLLAKMGMARRTEAAVYAARLEERRRRSQAWDLDTPSTN